MPEFIPLSYDRTTATKSNQPIKYLANEKILGEAQNAMRQIIVDYEVEGSRLRAIAIQY